MKTVILCGGQGTRIRNVAEDIPKPMIPIGGRPILWHIMKAYAAAGYEEFILCLGYKSAVVKDFFLNYETYAQDFTITLGPNRNIDVHGDEIEADWRITLAETGLKAMTGARIKQIEKYIGEDEHFMLTYGDGVSDVPIGELEKFHLAHGKVLTVTGVRPPGRFGEMEMEPNGKVTEFNEKPQTSGGLISGGFFVCRRDIFDYLNDDISLIFEKSPMRHLVSDGELMVYEHDGFWQCMDTPRDFELLSGLWDSGEAQWKTW